MRCPFSYQYGGEHEIRTHGRDKPSLAFQASALSHSANSPISFNRAIVDKKQLTRKWNYLVTQQKQNNCLNFIQFTVIKQ